MLKLTLITFALFIVLSQVTLAQETATVSPGVTPDSFLYNFDVALDQIKLLLTFDNTAKARVGLEIARERLGEVREMALKNKLEAMQRAQTEHRSSLDAVRTSVSVLSRANSTQEVEDEVEIERGLEEHEDEVETVSQEIDVKIKIKGNITSEQQALINSILSRLQNVTGEVKIKIVAKKGETKIKIKKETGKGDEEIEEEVEKIEKKARLIEVREKKALERIEDAVEEISELKALLDKVNATEMDVKQVLVLLNESESHLARAEKAFSDNKFGETFGQATSAEKIAKNAKRILERIVEEEEKDEEEVELEAEIERGRAKVKVEINETKFKFVLNTTGRDAIVLAIVEKTGLSREEVEKLLKFEVEKKKEVKERLEEIKEKKRELEKEKERIRETRIKEKKEEKREREKEKRERVEEKSEREEERKGAISERSESEEKEESKESSGKSRESESSSSKSKED